MCTKQLSGSVGAAYTLPIDTPYFSQRTFLVHLRSVTVESEYIWLVTSFSSSFISNQSITNTIVLQRIKIYYLFHYL